MNNLILTWPLLMAQEQTTINHVINTGYLTFGRAPQVKTADADPSETEECQLSGGSNCFEQLVGDRPALEC